MPNSSGGCNKRGGRAKKSKILSRGGCRTMEVFVLIREGGCIKMSKSVIPGAGTIRYGRVYKAYWEPKSIKIIAF